MWEGGLGVLRRSLGRGNFDQNILHENIFNNAEGVESMPNAEPSLWLNTFANKILKS